MERRFFNFLILGLFTYIAWPFLIPLAMAAVFAVIFFPILELLEKRKVPIRWASAFLTIGITLLVILPGAVLIFLGARGALLQIQAVRQLPRAQGAGMSEQVLQLPAIKSALDHVIAWFPSVEVKEIVATAEDILSAIGIRLANAIGNFFGHLPVVTMGVAVMVVAIYFFLVDGRKILAFIRSHSVFESRQTEKMIRSFAGLCRSVVLAAVASAVAQAAFFTVGCLICSVSGSWMIGLLVFLASFVPLIGSAPITFGVAIRQLLIGNRVTGLVLLAFAVVTSVVDNVVRPMILGGSGGLHPLLAFVAAFGGLMAFGFTGVFLGPIVAGLFVVTVLGIVEKKATGS